MGQYTRKLAIVTASQLLSRLSTRQVLPVTLKCHKVIAWTTVLRRLLSRLNNQVNSLRPSDAIWRQWSWTTLAQVMACCLTAPSHYLNQCWLIIRGVLWHTSESSFAGIAQGIDSGYEFEKDILKNIFKSPRGQWVNVPTSSIQFRPEFAGPCRNSTMHYDDVIMTILASQITSLTVVYSIVYSGVNQRKHQSSASLAFVREIHRGPVNFPHKWPVTRKMFPFDDVIMDIYQSCCLMQSIFHLIISQQISTICCATIYQCLLPVLMKQKWLIDWYYERHKPPSVQVFEVKLVPNKNGIIKCEYIFTKNYACARKCIHSSPCDAIWW